MLEENIEDITKSDSNFAPTLFDHHVLPDINFNEHCLINNIYIPKKGLDDATLAAEAKCPINFTQPRIKFVLSLYYNGSNSF